MQLDESTTTMYITFQNQTQQIVHVSGVAPGHSLCGKYVGRKITENASTMYGAGTQEEVLNLDHLCRECREHVKPQRCHLIMSARWHDCGHCSGVEGKFCNGTLTEHRAGKYEHDFEKDEVWSPEATLQADKLRKRR